MPAPLDPTTAPQFTGNPSSVPCPKCDEVLQGAEWMSSVLTVYTNGQVQDDHPNGSANLPDDPGFFVRRCSRCNHIRVERTLDDTP